MGIWEDLSWDHNCSHISLQQEMAGSRRVLETTCVAVTVSNSSDLCFLSASHTKGNSSYQPTQPKILLKIQFLTSFLQCRGGLGKDSGDAELITGNSAHMVPEVFNTLQPL